MLSKEREFSILLLDYYGELLTDHQLNVLSDYLNDDLSMNEIADNLNITKSAVQDLIKRTLNQLNEYENKLKLIDKDKKISIVIDEMARENSDLLNKYIKKIEKIK